jgi:hypothetical protein
MWTDKKGTGIAFFFGGFASLYGGYELNAHPLLAVASYVAGALFMATGIVLVVWDWLPPMPRIRLEWSNRSTNRAISTFNELGSTRIEWAQAWGKVLSRYDDLEDTYKYCEQFWKERESQSNPTEPMAARFKDLFPEAQITVQDLRPFQTNLEKAAHSLTEALCELSRLLRFKIGE